MDQPKYMYVTDRSLDEIIQRVISKSQERRLLTVQEVGEILRLEYQSVLNHKEKIGFVKLGKSILFKESDVMHYVNQNHYK